MLDEKRYEKCRKEKKCYVSLKPLEEDAVSIPWGDRLVKVNKQYVNQK